MRSLSSVFSRNQRPATRASLVMFRPKATRRIPMVMSTVLPEVRSRTAIGASAAAAKV